MGEPTEFTDQRQRDRLKQMMIVAREVARTAPVEADGPGNEVSTWDTWSDFAIAYYRTVNWKGAAAEARLAIEFEAANRMNPNELGSEHTLLVMAPLMLLEGEQAAFQQLCQLHPAALRMANQDPDAAGQSRRILREHQKVRAVDRGQGWSVWSRGLANLRSGNYQKAEKLFHRSAVHYPGIGNQLKKNLAIAITHRLNGDKSQAEQRLAKARELYEDYQAGGDYFHDRIEIAVLRAEAGRIISDEEKEDSIREEARTWTEASGKTTEAKFLNVANGFVVLETAAETILQIALERLSESDREFCVARQGS